jgi:hypothetical protein
MYGTLRKFAVFEAACPIVKFGVHHSSTVGDFLFNIFGIFNIYGGRPLHSQVEEAPCYGEGDTLYRSR